MGTALKRHKLSIDVIITLHVHHKIQQINTRYKILQKDITMYLLQSIFFFSSSLFLIIIPLILPHLFLLQMSHQIFFLAFSYTIVSTLSQLKKTTTKNNTNFTLTYFMCCLKIIFLVVNASNLIIRIPFERKLKNAINKIYLLAKVSHFLKNDIVKLQNTEKTEFSLTPTGTSQSHGVKDFFLKHVYIYYIIS